MQIGTRKIDHLVYCVLDLDSAIEQLYDEIGVRAIVGGRHLNQGTKNALINLGDTAYLELLAIDESNKQVAGPRWMGIDLITKPKITRWAIHSDNLEKDSEILKSFDSTLGEIIGGEREKESGEFLRWKMIKPLAKLEVDILPFMIDWSESDAHPTEGMEEICSLEKLEIYSKRNGTKQDTLKLIFEDIPIQSSEVELIRATIKGPSGMLII